MNKFVIDFNQFHPDIRDEMRKEADYLQANYPLMEKSTLDVIVGTVPEGENVPARLQTMEGSFAVTQRDKTPHQTIFFNPKLFGLNADIVELRKHFEADDEMGFHGGMAKPSYVLSHEYGHVIQHMTERLFDHDKGVWRGDKRVVAAYSELYEQANKDKVNKSEFILSTIFKLKPNKGKLVSGYANFSKSEFFADTFAALCHGDEKTKALPTVALMEKLLTAVYQVAREHGAV